MASQSNFNFPFFYPPPPSHSPSPDSQTMVVVIVFVSIGGVFFLAFLAAVLFCFLKKRKNKKKTVEEAEMVHIDEHKKIQEVIVEGPHGTQSVVVSVEDDIHVEVGEKIKKNEKGEKSLQSMSVETNASTSVVSSAPS